MTRVVIDGREVGVIDGEPCGDPSALARMASGPNNPEPPLTPTAADIDPAPPDPGLCPTCGQRRPNLVNTFATTGDRAPLASYEVEVGS
jgi:hypothetical protein